MLEKNKTSKNKLLLISLIFSLHLLGIIVAFFRTKIPFNFHLLRFFSWWSVHTSIFTVLAAILTFREKKLGKVFFVKQKEFLAKQRKKISFYFLQFITFLATMYNLITLCFGTYCLFFADVGGEKSSLLNGQSFSGHFIAPLLTILYFYLCAQVYQLRKKLAKTLSLAFIAPVFYFFYVGTLAKLNTGESSSLFPHLEKYPYSIFKGIVDREGKQFIINFLISLVVFFSLCSLIIGTKLTYDKKTKKIV